MKSGACDSLVAADMPTPASARVARGDAERTSVDGPPLRAIRAKLFAAIDGACEHGSRTQRNKDLGQEDLFGGVELGASGPPVVRLPDVPPWTEIHTLLRENAGRRALR